LKKITMYPMYLLFIIRRNKAFVRASKKTKILTMFLNFPFIFFLGD
jgi:hypothetical protein